MNRLLVGMDKHAMFSERAPIPIITFAQETIPVKLPSLNELARFAAPQRITTYAKLLIVPSVQKLHQFRQDAKSSLGAAASMLSSIKSQVLVKILER